MKTTLFLATLVAVCLTVNGCYALTGCPGSPQCDPNWEGATDGDNDAGSTVSKNDSAVTAETTEVEVAPTVSEVCKGFMHLEGMKWYCKWLSEDPPICPLNLLVLKSDTCWVNCNTTWTVQANTISFPSPDEMVLEPAPGAGPHTCTKVK